MKKTFIGDGTDAATTFWEIFHDDPRYVEIREVLSKIQDTENLIYISWCTGFQYALENSGTIRPLGKKNLG